MSRLNDDILIEALEENFADDPYSTATFVIRNIIHRALNKHGETMSYGECSNLVDIEERLRVLDNA